MTRSASASKRTRAVRKPATPALATAPAAPPPIVYVLSDSTGNLARHLLAAPCTQFPPGSFSTHFHTFLRDAQRLEHVLELVRVRPGPICHAFVSTEFKRRVAAFCETARLAQHDL